MRFISVKDLSLSYDGRNVLEGLNFEVNSGDYLCVIGENGSGKTTLMKALLGLKKPLKGSISYGDDHSKKDIGYLPQLNDVQKDFPATVMEVVLSGFQGKCGLHPFYDRSQKEEALRKMEYLGIEELAKHSFRELSGGQRQRVLLGRALCAAKEAIFLDEPLSGLDQKSAEDVYSLVKRLNAEGMTVIMISHDLKSALNYASHILDIGDEVFFGSREDYLKHLKRNDVREEEKNDG